MVDGLCRERDSNPWTSDHETDALTNCAMTADIEFTNHIEQFVNSMKQRRSVRELWRSVLLLPASSSVRGRGLADRIHRCNYMYVKAVNRSSNTFLRLLLSTPTTHGSLFTNRLRQPFAILSTNWFLWQPTCDDHSWCLRFPPDYRVIHAHALLQHRLPSTNRV